MRVTPKLCTVKGLSTETRIIVPRWIGQYRKQRMHGARTSSRRILQYIDGLHTNHCDILPENRKCEDEHRHLNLGRVYKRSSVACAGCCLIIIFHVCKVEEMEVALMVGILSVAGWIVRCCCSCQDLNGSIAKLPKLPGPGGDVSQQWVLDSSL